VTRHGQGTQPKISIVFGVHNPSYAGDLLGRTQRCLLGLIERPATSSSWNDETGSISGGIPSYTRMCARRRHYVLGRGQRRLVQTILPPRCRLYHQAHERGLYGDFPQTDWRPWYERYLEAVRAGWRMVVNEEDWGLG
jgi:hypothetical protein